MLLTVAGSLLEWVYGSRRIYFYCGGWTSSSWMKQQGPGPFDLWRSRKGRDCYNTPFYSSTAELNIGGTQIARSFAPNAFRQRGLYVL